MSIMIHKQRRRVAVRPISSDKKPYLLNGTVNTILHLTTEQAAKRLDLIPQFQRVPLALETLQA